MYNSRKQKRENRHDGTSGRIKKSGGAGKVFGFYDFDKRSIEKCLKNSYTASLYTKQSNPYWQSHASIQGRKDCQNQIKESPYPKRTPGIDKRRPDQFLDFRIEKQKQQAR